MSLTITSPTMMSLSTTYSQCTAWLRARVSARHPSLQLGASPRDGTELHGPSRREHSVHRHHQTSALRAVQFFSCKTLPPPAPDIEAIVMGTRSMRQVVTAGCSGPQILHGGPRTARPVPWREANTLTAATASGRTSLPIQLHLQVAQRNATNSSSVSAELPEGRSPFESATTRCFSRTQLSHGHQNSIRLSHDTPSWSSVSNLEALQYDAGHDCTATTVSQQVAFFLFFQRVSQHLLICFFFGQLEGTAPCPLDVTTCARGSSWGLGGLEATFMAWCRPALYAEGLRCRGF